MNRKLENLISKFSDCSDMFDKTYERVYGFQLEKKTKKNKY